MLAKLDKDFHVMLGLGKRLKSPEDYDIEKAKELKILMQERVMELWNEH